MILADFRLAPGTRRTLRALVPIVCPPDAEGLGLVEPIVAHTETSLRSLPPLVRAGLVAGLATFEAAAILRHARPFARLRRDRARAHFESFWHSPFLPFRQLVKGVKALLVLAYYEHPVVRRQLAYHPERWIAEAARARLERHAEAIRAHEEMIRRPDPLVRLAVVKEPHVRRSA